MKYEPRKDQLTFEKAIEEASGSADWLYPEEEYEHLILTSSSMYEEDYWHIMERMSQVHHQQKSESSDQKSG